MKRGWLLIALVSVFLVSSCVRESGRIIVGASIPTQREERWVRDVKMLVEESTARGIDFRLQISDNDAARQLAQCENLIAAGVHALILAPHDAFASAVVVEKAHRARIPVIAYDRMVMNSDVDVYMSFDNVRVGELQGVFITRAVPRGNYVVLSGAPTDNNAKLFLDGAMKVIGPLARRGDIKIVMNQSVKDWQPSEAMKLMENALTANRGRIDAVLAPNDGTAGGVIQALAQQKLAGKVPVTGQDAELAAAKRVLDGTQSMTIYKDTRELARTAIRVAEKLAHGVAAGAEARVPNGRRDVPSVLLPPTVVDKNNIDAVLVGSGYFKKEELYGGGPER